MRGAHFSDHDVRLYNTLDYPAYSLAIEKVRAAFRMSYSLLDKISFFLNHYLQLGNKPKNVSFRSVWYEAKGANPRPLLGQFTSCPNWPLCGLFWLSKDLFEEEFNGTTEPDAEALKEMRDVLEHKYLQLHQEMISCRATAFRYSLYKAEFAERTLRVLKLVRAAMIYLSLAVRSEERMRGRADAVPNPAKTDQEYDARQTAGWSCQPCSRREPPHALPASHPEI
jgi:hypothetical protein